MRDNLDQAVTNSKLVLSMDDPFFAAKKRNNGAPWGQHGSYVEDIFRTYKPDHIPKRDTGSFEKALEFRLKEKKAFEDLRGERDHYGELLFSSSSKMSELTSSLESMTAQFSSLKAEHERHLASSTRTRSIDHVPPEPRADVDRSREEEPVENVLDDGREGTQLRAADMGGHAAEHSTPERPPGDDDGGGGESVREEPVREGGE